MYLYWRDDQDLIALKASRGKDFQNVVKECLSAYLNGEPYSFPPIWEYAQSYSNEMTTLTFSDKDDAAIINFLNLQPKGQQSNTVKFIIRAYMDQFHDENYKKKDLHESFIKLKLSTGHDADLLCLYYYNEKLFEKWVVDALRSYIKKEPYSFQVPEDWTPISGKAIRSKTATIHFTEGDAEVIKYLNDIKDGLRENAVKNIFRSSFSRPILCAEMELEILSDKKRDAANKVNQQNRESVAPKRFPVPLQTKQTAKPVKTQLEKEMGGDQREKPEPPIQNKGLDLQQDHGRSLDITNAKKAWEEKMQQFKEKDAYTKTEGDTKMESESVGDEFDMDLFDGFGR